MEVEEGIEAINVDGKNKTRNIKSYIIDIFNDFSYLVSILGTQHGVGYMN